MVKVSYKSRKNMSYMLLLDSNNNNHNDNKVIADISEYIITKKYKFSPLHNGDTPYKPDYYYQASKAGHNTKYHRWCNGDEIYYRRAAISTTLHQATNYNDLVDNGLYNVLSREQIYTVLKKWYDMITLKFPKYREACELELARHMTNYDLGQAE